MKAENYINKYVGILILVALVGATGGTLLTNMTTLNTTFADTGLGSLFSKVILGLVFAAGIFYAIYKGVTSLAK